MKIISLNIEGRRHLDKALPFLKNEKPDCIALMEAPIEIQGWLQKQGYQTTFSPRVHRHQDGQFFETGIYFASYEKHTAHTYYYHRGNEKIVELDENNVRMTISNPVIFASIGNINIATTHFTWNPNGETADTYQKTDLKVLLSYLKNQPSHILCGDFNIPRHINILYNEIIKHYSDSIPSEYKSSLDSFMVDYVFTQPPFYTSNTRFEFGVSDHAAIITNIN